MADPRLPWAVITAVSVIDVIRAVYLSSFTGEPGPLWKVWIYELSSLIVLLALVPFTSWISRRFSWRAFSWKVATAHAAGSIIFCLVHVGSMIAVRQVMFTLLNDRYDFGPALPGLAYEYGKDLFTYAFFVALFTLHGWLSDEAARRQQAEESRASGGIAVRTSRGSQFLPFSTLFRIEACGNYLTLVTGQGEFLHRMTMKEIKDLLPPGEFVRTHRSHIVRLSLIRGLRTNRDGEKELELNDGVLVPLGRTYAKAHDWLTILSAAVSPTVAPAE